MEKLLLALLMALQIADVCTTYFVISRGIGHEANPIMLWMLDSFGLLPGLLIPKAAMLSLVGLYLLAYPVALALLCLGYAIVVYRNVKVIRAGG